jgi:cobalamin biosynthesis Mg chelatase CobN
MFPTDRRPGRSSAPTFFSLLSVLALLALASFPVLAQAEDSSSIQYQDAPPSIKVPGQKKSHPSEPGNPSSEAQGEASSAPGAGGTGPNGSGGGGGSSSNNASSGNPSTGNGTTPGQANSGNGSTAGQIGVGPGTATGSPTSSTTSDGGSSPLVPILIAIAVLAAISVGAVLYRQRRQRGDAGGSGAVSPRAS